MIRWVLNRFKRVRIREPALELVLDCDESGKSTVEVYMIVDGQREKVKDISKIWNYGSKIERNGKLYTVPIKYLKILHLIRNLNPEIHEDGRLYFDVHLQELKYLLSKSCVQKSSWAEKN